SGAPGGGAALQHSPRFGIRIFESEELAFGRPGDRLDAAPRPAGHLAYLAILKLDEGARRRIAVQTAELRGRDLSVGGSAAIFVDDIEQHETVRLWLLFLGHAVNSSVSRRVRSAWSAEASAALGEKLSQQRRPVPPFPWQGEAREVAPS